MYCSKGAGGQFYPSESRTHYPSIVEFSKVREKLHDAEKPVELIEDLIRHFTKEGALVLDPFAGSCSTAEATKNCNRHYIGIELNPDYIKICNDRLAPVLNQPTLI